MPFKIKIKFLHDDRKATGKTIKHFNHHYIRIFKSSLPRWLSGKESTCNAEDMGSIPGSEKSPGEGNSNPLQYSCLGNPMDRGAWQATVHEVTKEVDTTKQLNNNKNNLLNAS